jgi:DNA primase
MIDFAEVKARVTLEQTATLLQLDLKQNGHQMRGRCPVCADPSATDDRSLVLTPSKGWYCFKAKKGGDQISLVSHVRGTSVKESAQLLADSFSRPEEKEKVADKEQSHTFNPYEYADKLDKKHELVTALGFTEADCERYGMGVAHKGVNAGRFCIPLREKDGKIVVFVSVAELKLPKKWRP